MVKEYKQTLEELLQTLLSPITTDYTTSIEREGDQWRVNITSEKAGEIIGTKGETIKSIQHLLRVLMHRQFPDDRSHFIIDVDGFRKVRELKIRKNIREVSQTYVLAKGTTIILIGLSSYERKVVHDILQGVEGLETTSVGVDPNRKLIIRPTSDTGATGLDNAMIVNIFDEDSISV